MAKNYYNVAYVEEGSITVHNARQFIFNMRVQDSCIVYGEQDKVESLVMDSLHPNWQYVIVKGVGNVYVQRYS